MLALLWPCLRKFTLLLCGSMLLGSAALVYADPKPLTREEQEKVDKAIDKGVAYLKRSQREKGDWPLYFKGGYPLGQTLLPVYALLESGVPADDPAIKKAIDFIRPRLVKLDRTYEVALAILLLDRLGDPKDKPLIRSLSMRLIAGQHVTGGWNYRCPTLGKGQEDALSKALSELSKRLEAGENSGAKLLRGLVVPSSMKNLSVFRSLSDPGNLPWHDPPPSDANEHKMLLTGTTDNSNTQFALLGLWVGQRHDVPVSPTFRLMVERFERTQYLNGGWSYLLERDVEQTKTRPSMLCVGLLGLAVGRGLKLSSAGMRQGASADSQIMKGLAAVSQDIGVAATGMEKTTSQRGAYYLWSLERLAMLYDLATIGDKDWYRWGAGILIVNQGRNGEWRDVLVSRKDNGGLKYGWGPTVDTSFALLFLKRSHPMKELTPKLPFKAKELNQGIARLLSGAPLESTTTPTRGDKPER